MHSFKVQNFGPIDEANVKFGDLTILIGQQASGKSMFLELLKLFADKNHILSNLKKYNYIVNKYDSKNILEIYFGEGMGNVITENTSADVDGEHYDGQQLLQSVRTPAGKKKPSEKVFYVPAQRIMSMDNGRSRNFMEFDTATPYVLRNFSETLRIFLQSGLGNPDVIFPMKNRLKGSLKASINRSIFHNSRVVSDQASGQRKMKLEIGDQRIPFMAWSAGQKEFLPLLLSFYCLSKIPNSIVKAENFKMVIIEEPEMGLHPRAIVSIILEIIDLMMAGYQVVVSTHSSVLLEFAWAFNSIRSIGKADFCEAMCELLDINKFCSAAMLFDGFYDKNIRTYLFSPDKTGMKGRTKDISTLDACSEDENVAEWGGLSWFSSKAADIVMQHAEEME